MLIPGRRPHRARRDRRPARDPRRLGAVPRLDRQRRRAARVAHGRAGVRDEPDRGHDRRRRHLARPARVRRGARDRRGAAPCAPRSSTSSTSTRPTTRSSRGPRRSLANRLRDHVEEPIVQGSLGEIGTGVTEVADGTARLQTGLLRSYALVIAALGRRPRRRLRGGPLMLTSVLIVLPLVGALVVWAAPLPRQGTAALALLVAARGGRAVDRDARRLRLRLAGPAGLAPSASGSATSASATPSASTASRSGSRG